MKNMKNMLSVLSLMGQLGFIIALPAVVFGFGGAYIDRALGTSPLFILVGLGIAIASSSLWVHRLIQRMNK